MIIIMAMSATIIMILLGQSMMLDIPIMPVCDEKYWYQKNGKGKVPGLGCHTLDHAHPSHCDEQPIEFIISKITPGDFSGAAFEGWG